MNKLIITIISTMLLTVTGAAVAQAPESGPGRKGLQHSRGTQPMPVVENLIRAVRRLDLTDEQQADIKAVIQGLRKDIRPNFTESKTMHKELQELVKAANYNEEAVAALAETEGKLAAGRLMITSRALSNIYGLLTEEQRAELATMAEYRMTRRSERRGPPKGEGDS